MARIGIAFQSDKTVTEYRKLASVVARYDFETVSVYQDLFYQPPWPALLQFAEQTTNPLVGPAVVNPYLCHPVLVASELAVLDEVSDGRAYLGVGRGAFFDAIGLEQPRPLRAIREAVEMVQRLLRGDHTPYHGQIFRASSDAYLRGPIPGRELPVLIGGWGPQTVQLAGEMADMLKVGGSANPESAPIFRRYLREGAERARRDPATIRLVYAAVTVVDRDRSVAEAIARREAAMYVGVTGRMDPTYSPPEDEMRGVEKALAEDEIERAGELLSEETLQRYACYGAPADILARVKELFDAGVDVFELGTPHGADEAEAIRMLGEEVLPHFAAV